MVVEDINPKEMKFPSKVPASKVLVSMAVVYKGLATLEFSVVLLL